MQNNLFSVEMGGFTDHRLETTGLSAAVRKKGSLEQGPSTS